MLVSIIIPCKDETADLTGLREDIARQKVDFSVEVVPVFNVCPPGRARNQGAEKAQGTYLVFLDCDIRLGDENFLAHLIDPLREGAGIGLTCAAIKASLDSNSFQQRYAREIPHAESPDVTERTDVQVAASACCAITKTLFENVGGFHPELLRGEDSVLSQVVKDGGSRVVLVPATWCYHPQPANLRELVRMNIRNGAGACFVDTFYPKLNLDVHPAGVTYFAQRKSLGARGWRYLTSSLSAIGKGQFLFLLTKIFYAWGYVRGIVFYRLLRKQPQ